MKAHRLTTIWAGIFMTAALAASIPLATHPASAASKPKPPKPIVCQAMTGNEPSPGVVSGCNRRGITGLSGTLTNCSQGNCITWAKGKETNFSYSVTVPTKNRCPSQLIEVDVVGKVVSALGAGTKPLIGAKVAYDACLTQQITVDTVELVPGTQFTIG